MNTYERRRRWSIGMSYIEEVVADVLREARDKELGVLERTQIYEMAGFTKVEDDPGVYWVCTGALRRMESRGEVANENPSGGPDKWRLAA